MDIKFITQELSLKNARRKNKLFLGIFLFIMISALIMKITDSILLDLGFKDGKIHLNFWEDQKWVAQAKNDLVMQKMTERHPNIFWIFTQFTWITTIMIIISMILRFFKYDQETLPRWIKWVMTQRTISLLAMYDLIVGLVFWSSMFKDFDSAFNPDLKELELTYTILVHAIIPVLVLTYSLIYLIRDDKASILKEMSVVKGMIYPIIYIIYYILIAVVWTDPYPITDLHNDFVGSIWLLPVAIVGMYIAIGVMLLLHNLILLRFNKKYDPKNDYEINMRKQLRIEKVQRKIIRKHK